METVVFFAVLGSSMAGAKLFGISIGKIALIPLEVYLFCEHSSKTFKFNHGQFGLVLWYTICEFSYISGLILSIMTKQFDRFIGNAFNQVFQIAAIYIPIALFIYSSSNKEIIIKSVIKNIVIVARIQALWGIAQFFLYYTMRFDLNKFVFSEAFGGMLGGWDKLDWME